ncbi:hypothetical protein HN011_005646 [Eciton burchellii]|nr:hypothetical protein HN011_005646 [Eciton burchellii]
MPKLQRPEGPADRLKARSELWRITWNSGQRSGITGIASGLRCLISKADEEELNSDNLVCDKLFRAKIRIVNEDAPICTEAEELAQQGFLDTSTCVTGICPSVKIYRYILYTDDIFMYKDLSSDSDSSTILALRVLYHCISKKNH